MVEHSQTKPIVEHSQATQPGPSKREQAIKRIYLFQFGDDLKEAERYNFTNPKV